MGLKYPRVFNDTNLAVTYRSPHPSHPTLLVWMRQTLTYPLLHSIAFLLIAKFFIGDREREGERKLRQDCEGWAYTDREREAGKEEEGKRNCCTKRI